MIFIDTGFFFALSASEENERHRQARELRRRSRTGPSRTSSSRPTTSSWRRSPSSRPTVTRNAHARAVRVGQQLYSEKLARIYRTTFEEQLEAFAYLQKHEDKGYSAVDCLSFVVMLKLGIQEAWTFDDHFSHRFIARPGPNPR